MVTGPAHCSKRMSRSSRYVKWLTLSRPPLPPGRGQASCGIRLRMRKNICFRHLGFATIQREMSHRASTLTTSTLYIISGRWSKKTFPGAIQREGFIPGEMAPGRRTGEGAGPSTARREFTSTWYLSSHLELWVPKVLLAQSQEHSEVCPSLPTHSV